MEKVLIARGQATIIHQKDGYSIHQSLKEYIFSCNENGVVTDAVHFTNQITVVQDGKTITNFSIGAVAKPVGIATVSVNQTNKSIAVYVEANTSTLADSGIITIPVVIDGITYNETFTWSKAKQGEKGEKGNAGTDANLLDWVADWNTSKTVIGSNSVITPKVFAGAKNPDDTLTGVALGRFSLTSRNDSGTTVTETIDGIYGFKDGYKTFAINNSGNVEIGRGNQFIRYNAATGKIEFGADVSLNWKNEADRAITEAKTYADGISDVVEALKQQAESEAWSTKLTYISSTGIFTGTLSANTINAIQLNASQITAGQINADRINVVSLKSELITAANINALALTVVRGSIGGWTIDADSIFKGAKNNTLGGYTAASSYMTIGSNGIRGCKWRLDANGQGAIAGGNISWDVNGDVTFGSSVKLNWVNEVNRAIEEANNYADEQINAIQIGASNLFNNSGNWRSSYWNAGITDNGGGYTIDYAVRHLGKPTLRTLVGSGVTHDWIKLENNVEYTYSAMILCNENISGSGNVPVHYHAGKDNTNELKINVLSHDTSLVANVWKKVYITFKLTGDADSFRPFIYRGTNGTTTFWIAYMKLEKGNKATDWTPSQSDTNAIIADAKQSGIDAQFVADALTLRANTEGWSTKLTYIGSTGIFTGTLSANTVNTLEINAGQIVAGQIDVARLNVTELKSQLITADNINALSLTVVRGSIGCWTIDADSIFKGTKNNTIGAYTAASSYMTIGSNGIRGYQWRLDADGAGAIAGGHISWNSSGAISFSNAVSLQWQDYADTKTDEAKELAHAMASGKMLFRDPTFINGLNSIHVYNNYGNGTVNHLRETDATAPTDDKTVICIRYTGGDATPGIGGFFFANMSAAGKIFITRFIAKIPVGYRVEFASNAIGNNGVHKWLTETAGTGEYTEYICKVTCGLSGAFSTTNFFSLDVNAPTNPVEWKLCYATVFDITSCEKYTTTINGEGIYTGTLNASQINAGKISANYLDAASIQADIVNASYINGLSCTFVQGKIGGWNIAADTIYHSYNGQHLILKSTQGDSPLGSNKGHRGFTIYGDDEVVGDGKVKIIQMGALADFNSTSKYDSETNYGFRIMVKGSKDIFRVDKDRSIIAGWNFDNDAIWTGTKVNSSYAYMGGNGITIGTSGIRSKHFRLESDGAGSIAGGRILWDSAGNITFSNDVKMNWEGGVESAKELAMAMAFGKALFRTPDLVDGNGIITTGNTGTYLNVSRYLSSLNDSPNPSKYVMGLYCDSWYSDSDRRFGGFYVSGIQSRPNATFVAKITAKIPTGKTLQIYHNSYGTDGYTKWLTSQAGTGQFEEYICKIKCGASGTFSTLVHYALTSENTSSIFYWYVSYIQVYDLSSSEKYITTINADGIYTGKIYANQLQIDSTVVVGGSAYNGSIAVRDASNVTKITLDRNGITAVGGTIGGWTIESSQISKNSVVLGADGSITNGNLWKLNKDGSGQLANGNISWTTAGTLTITGNINATGGKIANFTIGYDYIGMAASGSGGGGGLALYSDLFRVGNSAGYALIGANVLPSMMSGYCTARFVNNNSGWYENNYGLIINVSNGNKNYGIVSDAPVIAPYCIGNCATEIHFNGSGYNMDLSQCNLFVVYASANYNITLPTEASVRSMFNLSELPYTFSVVFTLVYHWSWGSTINIQNVYDNNGVKRNFGMAKGDVLTLMVSKIGGFHYQCINYKGDYP